MAVVTLLTDFGTRDGYVGAMKGVIHALAPSATVVDITHDVPPQDIPAAAFALAQAAPFYPAGTIHVVVVDPGVGGRRRGVVLESEGQLYVGPDNGVLSLAAPVEEGWEITSAEFRRREVSATFHGRDVFAPAAARLAGGAKPAAAGARVALEGRLAPRPVLFSHNGRHVTGHVVHVDRFGNLITDIVASVLPSRCAVRVGSIEVPRLGVAYEDVARGEIVAYVGSAGTLELAVRDGAASEVLGVGRGAPVVVMGSPVTP
ncbi:MAG TPA: SAM-dependent chlorinase/fluorinase [Haliangiales bacterium]|nr:SAM-dependent chlorinase/fluorinase [Haliangiales bacterium]